MKKLSTISIVFIFFACEKEIQLDIANAGKKIVVQAMIQEGYPPIVQLTWSDSYFANFDSNNEMFIKGAEVLIFNHDRTDFIALTEIETLFPVLPPGTLPGEPCI